jgi:hypothetical protein
MGVVAENLCVTACATYSFRNLMVILPGLENSVVMGVVAENIWSLDA